ncbi:hypothetical protein F7725_025972, partial [Dissostichus mawsoni]
MLTTGLKVFSESAMNVSISSTVRGTHRLIQQVVDEVDAWLHREDHPLLHQAAHPETLQPGLVHTLRPLVSQAVGHEDGPQVDLHHGVHGAAQQPEPQQLLQVDPVRQAMMTWFDGGHDGSGGFEHGFVDVPLILLVYRSTSSSISVALRQFGNKKDGFPRVHINGSKTVRLGYSKSPTPYLSEEQVGVGAEPLFLLPPLQHHHRPRHDAIFVLQSAAQTPAVLCEQSSRNPEGLVPQP